MTQVSCEKCKHKFTISDKRAGTKQKCPSCGEVTENTGVKPQNQNVEAWSNKLGELLKIKSIEAIGKEVSMIKSSSMGPLETRSGIGRMHALLFPKLPAEKVKKTISGDMTSSVLDSMTELLACHPNGESESRKRISELCLSSYKMGHQSGLNIGGSGSVA